MAGNDVKKVKYNRRIKSKFHKKKKTFIDPTRQNFNEFSRRTKRKVRVRGVRHDPKREHLIEENAAPSAAEADAQPIPSSLKRLMDARSSAQQPRPKRRRGQTSAFTGASRGQESAAAQLQRRPGEPRAAFLKRAERDAYRRVEEAHVRLRIQH